MPKRSCLAIILAAGEGTRMRSDTPKVMHPVGGRPMLGYVIETARAVGAGRMAVVIGPGADATRRYVEATGAPAAVYEQRERLGTAHAVLAARKELSGPDDILVLYGDTPRMTAQTLKRMRRALAGGAEVVVLGFRPPDPARYGRLIVEGKQLLAIREFNDATPEERTIGLCNAGVMAFAGTAAGLLKKIGNDNAKGEYYLTNLVELANAAGKKVVALEADPDEVLGVDNRMQLAVAERLFQQEARRGAMEGGATLVDPETVYFSFDTRIGRDVFVEPHVFFGPGVSVADGATIRAYSHIEGATIAGGALIGPFARLRPGTDVGGKARVGNFVEVKNAVVDAGAKINHLSYIGDAHVGAAANIGAGTITCNYDGYFKYHTEIGAGAFIGSNSALVAPVTIGDGAYVGSGSVVTRDVEPDALAVARGRQFDRAGWAADFRKRSAAKKKARR
ncbi:MAG: bifunctional UDP-N-acetylglucosamine diphosphorylase/glucosamine-1-phosphate N-acetyltransferase GlmU [Bauldia sp.]|nr:bifunctional UDP-N-acetylglucosamine diphosphorylase/glucosamine-1-phosphate N-acetyltransferase GlmU [Bauldia sp.]